MLIRRQTHAGALICAAFAVVSTTSRSQESDRQSLAVKADTASLCALVGKHQVIALKYGYDPDTAEPREIEPYAVGYTRKGNILLFGRQVKGYSKSAESGAGELPGWRNFRVDKIKTRMVNALTSTFEPIRPASDDHRSISEFACRNESAFSR
jgi:hypothetical protein